MTIVWSPQAVRDLRAIRAFIAQENPDAAGAVAERILDAVERLATYPASGRPGRVPNTRELPVTGTPFLIPYRVTDIGVEVIAVIHGARKWPEPPVA